MRLKKQNICDYNYGIWIRSREKSNPYVPRASYLYYDLRVENMQYFQSRLKMK